MERLAVLAGGLAVPAFGGKATTEHVGRKDAELGLVLAGLERAHGLLEVAEFELDAAELGLDRAVGRVVLLALAEFARLDVEEFRLRLGLRGLAVGVVGVRVDSLVRSLQLAAQLVHADLARGHLEAVFLGALEAGEEDRHGLFLGLGRALLAEDRAELLHGVGGHRILFEVLARALEDAGLGLLALDDRVGVGELLLLARVAHVRAEAASLASVGVVVAALLERVTRGEVLEVGGKLRVARVDLDGLLDAQMRLAPGLDAREHRLALEPHRLVLLLLLAEDLERLGRDERAELEQTDLGRRLEHAEQVIRVEDLARPHVFSERELVDGARTVELLDVVARGRLAARLVEEQRDLVHRLVLVERARVEPEALRVQHQRVLVVAGGGDGLRVVEELARLLGLGDEAAAGRACTRAGRACVRGGFGWFLLAEREQTQSRLLRFARGESRGAKPSDWTGLDDQSASPRGDSAGYILGRVSVKRLGLSSGRSGEAEPRSGGSRRRLGCADGQWAYQQAS